MKFSPVSSLGIDASSCLLLHPLKMTKENYYWFPFKILLTILNYLHVIELGSVINCSVIELGTWEAGGSL